jgi:predicted homoserine dehydrogenase-like protein
MDRLVSEVFAVAKRDLQPGDVLDAIGGTTYYSLIDTFETARAENLLPIGLAKGARVTRPVPKDAPIHCNDVEVKDSMILALRGLQDAWFAGALGEKELLASLDALVERT